MGTDQWLSKCGGRIVWLEQTPIKYVKSTDKSQITD